MKPLLLTAVLLGLVAVLEAQDALSEGQEFQGIWYIKAMVSDKVMPEDKRPYKMFPLTVTALEGGDLEATVVFWKKGQCREIKIVMKKSDRPGEYTAFNGKKTIYIQKLPVGDHYLLYCEGEHHGKWFRKGKLMGRDPEENPEALEEFKKFTQLRGFSQKNIIVPEQSEQCTSESD